MHFTNVDVSMEVLRDRPTRAQDEAVDRAQNLSTCVIALFTFRRTFPNCLHLHASLHY